MQKARRHPLRTRRYAQAPTACMHTVSGSLSLAVRRSFHLSLTVLSTIGHRLVFSLGGWSPLIQPGFLVPRPTRVPSQLQYSDFAYGTLTPYGPPFQARFAILSCPHRSAPQPRKGASPYGLGSSHFARRYSGNLSFDFFSSRYLDVSVPSVGPAPKGGDGVRPPPGCPIRISPDLSSLAAPRGFSQLATSFFAGLCLGIHRVHFLA